MTDSAGEPRATVVAAEVARRLDSVTAGSAFEWGYVALSAWVVGAAYFDARTYVTTVTGYSSLAPWQDAAVHAGWLALTLWLVVAGLRRVAGGMPWSRSLPTGYDISLAAALVLGMLFQLDAYEQLLWGDLKGLDNIVSPVRVAEILTATLLVTGPLRSAWRRGDPALSPQAAISAGMLLAALTFFTQFAHPLRDPVEFMAGRVRPPAPMDWVLQDFGTAAIVLQASILVAFALLLMRRFPVRPGTFLVLFTLDGALVAALKGQYAMILATATAGAVADLGLLWLRPVPAVGRRVGVRVFSAGVAAAFAAGVVAVVAATTGTWWDGQLLTGVVVAAGLAGYLLSHLVFPSARQPLGRHPEPGVTAGGWPAPRHAVDLETVAAAIEALDQPARLAESPLVDLPALAGDRAQRVVELRDLLIDTIRELAAAHEPRDAEAGRLLLDYYVRRVGTHDVVAERLHLSRPTLFRRRQRGLARVAEMLDELGEAARL